MVRPARLNASLPSSSLHKPTCGAGRGGRHLCLETRLTGGGEGGSVVRARNCAFSFSPPCAPLPFSCQLRCVKSICAPASLPPLKQPLGSPSLSLSLAFDVSDRHMVAGLSPSFPVRHPLFTMAAVPEGHLGLKGEMSPPCPHFCIFQAFLAVKLLRLFCHLCVISREMLGAFYVAAFEELFLLWCDMKEGREERRGEARRQHFPLL